MDALVGVVNEEKVSRVETPALEISDVYEAWFDEVVRWITALGASDSEVEDAAQEVFIVVAPPGRF